MGACLKLCKKCSGVSPKDFKGVVAKGDIRTGCFGHCAKKYKELEGKAYVKYDGAIVARVQEEARQGGGGARVGRTRCRRRHVRPSGSHGETRAPGTRLTALPQRRTKRIGSSR